MNIKDIQIGDKLKITRKSNKNDKNNHGWNFTMDQYIGDTFTVSTVSIANNSIHFHEIQWSWPSQILERSN